MHQEEIRTLTFTAGCVDQFLDMITQELRNKYVKTGDVLELEQGTYLTKEEEEQIIAALMNFTNEETPNSKTKEEIYQLLLETQKEQANLQEKLLNILEQQKQDIKDLQQLLNNQSKQNNNQIYLLVFCLLVALIAVCYECRSKKNYQYLIDY